MVAPLEGFDYGYGYRIQDGHVQKQEAMQVDLDRLSADEAAQLLQETAQGYVDTTISLEYNDEYHVLWLNGWRAATAEELEQRYNAQRLAQDRVLQQEVGTLRRLMERHPEWFEGVELKIGE